MLCLRIKKSSNYSVHPSLIQDFANTKKSHSRGFAIIQLPTTLSAHKEFFPWEISHNSSCKWWPIKLFFPVFFWCEWLPFAWLFCWIFSIFDDSAKKIDSFDLELKSENKKAFCILMIKDFWSRAWYAQGYWKLFCYLWMFSM